MLKGTGCALQDNGTIDCWGENLSGQLGNGTTSGANGPGTPSAVSGLTGAKAIAVSPDFARALLSGGTVEC